ncbi:MAG: FeoB-associated Cys-rich membrane protein [Clostridiales bacterium]|jgi:hypothetical protein|nr:FeoB-associated Cys-rich membrane protein [Clostridiales bacterium]HOA33246.1 FeoB-associated Cys-rich membrane protein [Clostridiales bacterium]HOJ35515.1 FeoB-associated Cys-rich membrane protein [Clostridiales bacterium]HPP67774.1 FeoB-associated Cys-rich membrane protein [Clostridiales bacterium]HPU67029.1 FeoB-associated Cys-rich membrane protein [Clostridiales bacterium]
MLEYIINNLGTIVVSLIVLALLVLAVVRIRRQRKQGGCAGCPGCSDGNMYCGGCELNQQKK